MATLKEELVSLDILKPLPIDVVLIIGEYADSWILFMGGHDGSSPQTRVLRYSIANRQWLTLNPMPVAQCRAKAIVRGDSVFVMGGVTAGARAENQVLCYSLARNTWQTDEKFCEMSDCRWDAVIASTTDGVVVCGGVGSDWVPKQRSCQVFDFAVRTWTKFAELVFPRVAACGVRWKNSLYVFGGGDPAEAASSGEKYDSDLKSWSLIAPLPRPCFSGCAVTVPHLGILLMGGADPHNRRLSNNVHLYKPDLNRWQNMPWDLPIPLQNFTAHYLDGIVYVCGGFSNGRQVAACWSLDLGAPEWLSLPSLPRPLSGMASVAV